MKARTKIFDSVFKKALSDNNLWRGLAGDAKALAIYEASIRYQRPFVVITPNIAVAKQLFNKLHFFTAGQKIEILEFPDRETLPYDKFSPHQDITSERLLALFKLNNFKGILIVSISTLLQRLPPKEFVEKYSFIIKKGELLDLKNLRNRLNERGYYEVQQVLEHGEFAIRGSIIDVFPTGSKTPYRLDLFDNEIDTIREFNPDTQLSKSEIENIRLLPAHEFSLDENATTLFSENWLKYFSENSINTSIYQKVTQGKSFPGAEYYLPLFFDNLASLTDYLPDNSLLIQYGNISSLAQLFWEKLLERYEQLRYDRSFPILDPKELFISIAELTEIFSRFTQIDILENNIDKSKQKKRQPFDFETKNLTDDLERTEKKRLEKILEQYLLRKNRVLLNVGSAGREALLLESLEKTNIYPKQLPSWGDFLTSNEKLCMITSPLTESFEAKEIVIITEEKLFNFELVKQKRSEDGSNQDPEAIIRDLTELKIGDPVVHINHGIGRYIGLETIKSDGYIADYLTLEYAEQAKLYVPITSLHLVSRYLAPQAASVNYDVLGNKRWERAKQKAAEQIRDVAAELLTIYANRATRKGVSFIVPENSYKEFAATFPFELTSDQGKAIKDVVADMRSAQSMDRLICGDVGFGKTEVALRAAFIATESSKQVAILAPTTLLVQQHYNTFQDRFKNWPVKIEVLSRFNTSNKQKQIIENLKNGKVDIVIGTHKLLQDNIIFRDLGLLVIDEEHRFGVRQKEKIKGLRSNIDILTLTATPIPRTLSMSLTEIRDLSIIASPPAKRLAVKTFIKEHEHNQIIREATSREVMRGGQVYFLHNDVKTIEQKARELRELLPDAEIKVAHGQMHKQKLEKIMSDFYQLKFNVLVCSTIIESGIDVPTANTMIIERADKFGLAQLYQLRGRVGRSHHQAYAYLLIPEKKLITSDANKRLEAFESMKNLGSGFALATYDLEIRGAGEILGEEQSGEIQAIGYTLYMQILERTVNNLQKGGNSTPKDLFAHEVKIDLQLPVFIPNNYIGDVSIRLNLYKRIASSKTQEELNQLQVELIDRFGLLPEATKTLFAITTIKQKCLKYGIKNIKLTTSYGYIEFEPQPKINPGNLIKLIQNSPEQYRLTSKTSLRFKKQAIKPLEIIEYIDNMIENLVR